MKLYIIKTTSTATPKNKNFSGEVHVHYTGKGQEPLATYGAGPLYDYPLTEYMVRTYGYTRRCDAARNWCYKNPENSEFWFSIAEIVEVEYAS